jgi:hypothetical protein
MEHMRHGGQKNGHLIITYADMAKYGLGHGRIRARAVREIEVLGLTEVTHGRAGNRASASAQEVRVSPTKKSLKKGDYIEVRQMRWLDHEVEDAWLRAQIVELDAYRIGARFVHAPTHLKLLHRGDKGRTWRQMA